MSFSVRMFIKFTSRPFDSHGKAKTPPYRADEATYGFTGAVRIRPNLVHLWYGEVDSRHLHRHHRFHCLHLSLSSEAKSELVARRSHYHADLCVGVWVCVCVCVCVCVYMIPMFMRVNNGLKL